MFPRSLLVAKAYKDEIRPAFLPPDSPGAVKAVAALLQLYRGSLGRSRREIELRVREVEARAEKFKVVRGLALLIERDSTFAQREGPPPPRIREYIFTHNPGGAVTPDDRERALRAAAAEFGVGPETVPALMWADFEEEYLLTGVPDIAPEWLLQRFNLGQCQTLLFRAEQLSLSFEGEEAYREAIRRTKRAGLMFTAEPGPPPTLVVEGVVAFLRSTERYGTRMAKLLPSLLTLPGWKLEAKVLHTDSGGKRKVRTLRLSSEISRYLGLGEETPEDPPSPGTAVELARWLGSLGLAVDGRPGPVASGGGFEFPDLLVEGPSGRIYVECVGYWSKEWVLKKLKRTQGLETPYLVIAPRELAVGASPEHGRLIGLGPRGIEGPGVKGKVLALVGTGRTASPSQRTGPPGEEGAPGPAYRLTELPRGPGERILPAGYRTLGSFAIRKEVLGSLRDEIALALPDLAEVEKVLTRHGLDSSVLGPMGFVIKWHGLDRAEVEER
jgi:hypothetical protein